MLIRNGCPRCGGYVYIDCDEYGSYKACIVCGYRRDLEYAVHARLEDVKLASESSFHKYEEIIPLPLENKDFIPLHASDVE